VDAAHNPSGAASLAAALREYFDFDEIVFVLGVLADKDAVGIIQALEPLAARFHATQSGSDRAIGYEQLGDLVLAATHEDSTYVFENIEDAVERARDWASEAPRRAVVVTGSITLVGDAMAIAEKRGWKTN
jgi:dihydrofolate synthase/folylpolyglutamate synthase